MKVMVLGATGFIGPAVVRRLLACGHEPVAVSRSADQGGLFAGVATLRLDRRDTDALAAATDTHQPDATIDLLAFTLAETTAVLGALTGRTGRYVMASSGDVYRQYAMLHRQETGEATTQLREEALLRTRLYPYRRESRRAPDDPDAWMDDYDKIPIERSLAETPGLAWAVARLPMVYGPGDRQRRFAWAIRPMLKGADTLEIDEAWAGWRCSSGYVDDVAEGLALAATHPAAAGQVFNVGPREAEPHTAWAARFAEATGWRGEVRAVPRAQVAEPGRGRLDALDLSYPMVMDSRAIRDALGYAEVTPPEEALRRTIGGEGDHA